MAFGSTGETIKKFAGSAVGLGVGVAVGVADAVGLGVGVADVVGLGVGVADAVGLGVGVADVVGLGVGVADAVGVAVQTFFLPDLTQLKVLPLITFFTPICLQGEPVFIVAASAGIEDVASNAAITSPE